MNTHQKHKNERRPTGFLQNYIDLDNVHITVNRDTMMPNMIMLTRCILYIYTPNIDGVYDIVVGY